MRRTLLTLVVAAAAAGSLAGCGSSGATTTTLSKAEFLAKGDAICKQGHDQFLALQEHAPTTADAAATLTQKLIQISESELSQIRDLNPPASLQPALDRYLNAREQGIAVLKRGLRAAQSNNFRAYARAQAESAKTQVRRLQLAQAVGFTQCSRPATSGSGTATTGG